MRLWKKYSVGERQAFDRHGGGSLKAYAGIGRLEMIRYLRELNRKGTDVYVFGCGAYGEKVFDMLSVSGIIVKGFFDNAYPEGGKLGDRPVLPLRILSGCDREKACVVIASGGRKAIEEQLGETGIKHVFDMRELATDYRQDFPVIAFPESGEPKVSILVTACNEWNYTYGCLRSLSRHKIHAPYEIIFGDDASTDMNKDAEQYFHGIKAVHNKERMNYLGNVNNIAKLAKGEYFVLLANDAVIVQDCWIDRMLEMMEADADIGIISGKYWIPIEGKYDTAFDYGDGWEEIRLGTEGLPQSVDFVWPVASMVRRAAWESVGGFSGEFLPAFCEDNDLCLKLIQKGYRCVYAPDIETIHFRGTSYERNEDVRRLLEKNRALFISKWKGYKAELGDRPRGSSQNVLAQGL